MTILNELKNNFPNISAFLSAESRKTSVWQDFFLCVAVTLTVTFYGFENFLFQKYISIFRVCIAILCMLVWLLMCLINGIRRRPWFLALVAGYWVIPNLIIFAFNHSSGYSLVLDVMMQYSRLLVGCPLDGVTSGLSLSQAATVLLILLFCGVLFFAGVIINPPEKKN